MHKTELFINSDNSLIVEFKDSISLKQTQYILGVKQSIESAKLEGFVEAVPAYNSLLIIFEAELLSPEHHLDKVQSLLDIAKPIKDNSHSLVEIPVCYDPSLAPDLEYVASHCGLTVEQVISEHSGHEYPVYMLGFLPGFLYLGGMNEKLYCPRRSDPRPKVEAGSVGIGGDQTGVYPVDSPGGWHIIGKTPIKMFNASDGKPSIAKPMDIITFKPISLKEFEEYEN